MSGGHDRDPVDLTDAERAELDGVLRAASKRTAARVAGLERDFQRIAEAVARDAPDDEHDPEGSTTAFERAQVAALLDDARHRQAMLEKALDGLRAGTYGRCVRCGRTIPFERLLARPGTGVCVRCASRPDAATSSP